MSISSKDYEVKVLRVNTPLRGIKPGSEIKVKARNGILIDQYWRRRLVDSGIDNCVTLVKKPVSAKKTSSKKKED